jgi:membrane-associated phospholipid phosphatase
MPRRDLILAILIFSVALAAFMWITTTIGSEGAPTSIDASVGTWLRQRATPPFTLAMMAISFLGAPSTLTAVTVVIGVMLARQREFERLIGLMTLVLGGNLLNYGLKFLIHRGRPTSEDPLLILTSYSFPSGHAMASTVFYGFVVTYVLTIARQRQNAAIAVGILMIGLVCLSRVYLGIHYVSDVLAGILEAIAWSTLALTTLRVARAHQQHIDPHRQVE